MTRILAAVAALVLTAGAAVADLGPLVSPAELARALETESPVVLDIRAAEAAAGQPAGETYAAGHIPGALNAPYARFRGPAENPGQPPSEAALTELFRALGLVPDSRVVIVHQGRNETDFGAAARVYWTLKSSGFQQLSILNGGIAAWIEAGQPLAFDPVQPTPSTIEVQFSDRWTASAADIRTILAGQDRALLLDARPKAFWSGEASHSAAARPGTLPQSRYFEHSGWFASGPAIVDAEAARSLAAAEGFAAGDQVISFCNTGHWAATNWFALSELAEVENVRLYPESMVGWSNAGGEMANVPGPLRNLWRQITRGL